MMLLEIILIYLGIGFIFSSIYCRMINKHYLKNKIDASTAILYNIIYPFILWEEYYKWLLEDNKKK